jgi:hypothetical protein
METGRGKKGKKAAWHLTLGVKDVIVTGIGIVSLMSFSFVLGALAGRGDIYRAANTLGLMRPESKPAVQPIPPLALAPPAAVAEPSPSPAVAPVAAPAPPTAAATAAAPSPAASKQTAAAAKGGHPTHIPGSIAPLPAPEAAAGAKKKSKAAQEKHEQKAREAKLLKERLEVARKLTFLNSLETPKAKKDKDKSKTGPAKPKPAAPVKVATYRNHKAAKAKQAELQKQGVKATLKQGKDNQGVYYTLYRQAPETQSKTAPKVAQRKEKPGASAPGH